MGKPVIFLLFVVALILGQRIFIRFFAKVSRRFSDVNTEENGTNTASDWRNSGKSRNFENAEYELENEDFFENEVTEVENIYEAFDGLSDDEIETIAEEAGILETAGGEDE